MTFRGPNNGYPNIHPPQEQPPAWWGQAPPWFQQMFGHLQPPRMLSKGVPGGANIPLDQAQWKGVLRLDSTDPDNASSPNNDHPRTLYVQVSPGPFDNTEGEETTRLGVALRFTSGIGNAAIQTIFNVPPNGILHAAFTGQTVRVEAALVQVVFEGDPGLAITEEEIDDPELWTASLGEDELAPTISIGILQNQALAMNEQQTPKRMVTVETSDMTSKIVAVPRGAQSVRVLGAAALVCGQITSSDGSDAVPFPVNIEVPLGPGVWEISIGGVAGYAHAIFGLGI